MNVQLEGDDIPPDPIRVFMQERGESCMTKITQQHVASYYEAVTPPVLVSDAESRSRRGVSAGFINWRCDADIGERVRP